MFDKSAAEKLMIKDARKVLFVNEPKNYYKLLGPLPKGAIAIKDPNEQADIIQVFVNSRKSWKSS